jgi:methyl-accepting chemotaxis protein
LIRAGGRGLKTETAQPIFVRQNEENKMSRVPGACRHFFIPAVLLPILGVLVWEGLNRLLPGMPGSVVWIVAMAIVAWLAAQFSARSLARALAPVHAAIEAVRVRGDLGARSGLSGEGVVSGLGQEFDKALASLQGIISQVYFNANELAGAATEVSRGAQRVTEGSSRQSERAESTASTLEQMTGRIDQVALHAGEASELAARASGLSQEGSRMVTAAAVEISHIVESVGNSAQRVRALGERSQAVGQVVETIRQIADQTNLLALNAAIEAARAGESGRGFAVVADEVRKLAERTSRATGEIAGTIAAIRAETEEAVSAIGASADQAGQGAATANAAAELLEKIRAEVEETRERIASIAEATREQAASSQSVVGDVTRIAEDIHGNHSAAERNVELAERLTRMAGNLKEVGVVFKLGRQGEAALNTHAAMPEVARRAAESVGKAFERALSGGRITPEGLFALDYEVIPNTDPKKFHTSSDRLADDLLPAIQEPVLEGNAAVVYAISADLNGYVPTHNRRFAQPLTGDRAHDLAHNRTKRLFDDAVGKRVGEHELPYLLQTYRRDTGEIMHDVSAPIYVQGRHWGGFRIGYRTDQV